MARGKVLTAANIEALETLGLVRPSNPLLEYPQYTKPAEYKDWKVPDILLSGNHAEIKKWRLSEAKKRTLKKK